MGTDLSAEQAILRDAVRDFVARERMRESSRDWDRDAKFPQDLWRKLAATGWCGLGVPSEYGGGDGKVADLAIVIEELAKGDPSFASTYMANQFSGVRTISGHGTDAQKAEYLPRMAAGEVMFAVGISEPDGGTDVLSVMRTKAERDGEEWVINGTKMWTTGATYSDYVLVLANTEADPPKKTLGKTLFIVPTDAPGLEIQKLEMMSSRASETTQTFYTDVRVPADAVVGEVGRGFYHLLDSLNNERILLAAMSLGAARQSLDAAVEYASQRKAFGRTVGGFQAIQHKLARCAMQLEAARLMTYHAADLQERGEPCQAEAAMAKVMTSEVAWEVAFHGTRLMGAIGISLESDMQRYLRDAWPPLNGPMTNEQALNIIGESLGLERSY
ncbi:MAG: acyl-CoA dehydrogenase family protein [Solirubrobacterales bacterium]